MRLQPAAPISRMRQGEKHRSFWAVVVALVLLLPKPAFAATSASDPAMVVVAFGAVALAVASALWALSTGRLVTHLREVIGQLNAKTRAAIAARDAIIEAGREHVMMLGPESEATHTYGGSKRLLEECLAGPDSLALSQALDDLSGSGAPFELPVQTRAGEFLQVRGRSVGGFAALWMDKPPAQSGGASADLLAAMDALPLPIWRRDRSLALVWVNSAYVEAVGASDPVAALTAANALEKTDRDLAGMARAEGRAIEAKRYAILNGERRALAFTDMPLEDGSIVGVAVDVTALSDAEARLQQHLEAHADTLDKLATAVAIFGRDQRLSFYNRAFALLWDLPEEWLHSHPSDGELLDRLREMRKLPEQRDYQAWKRGRLSAYDHRDTYLPEELWHLPGGQTLRVVAQPHPFGGLTYLYEDVTEKIALESSYNTLISVQRATLDTLSEAVAVFGPDGRLKLHNAAFAQLWQFEPEELNSGPHVQKIAAACVQRFGEEAAWQKLVSGISSGAERRRDWGEFERFDRTIVTVSLAPLPDGATLATFADVTDRFRIEAALRERNEALVAADRLKSDFVQHASFLFRDPLNAVQGFGDMLAAGHAGALTSKQQDYVQSILAASHRLAEITSDILDLAMIESGNMRLELARVDIYELVTRAAEPLKQHAKSLDIDFRLDVAPGIGVAVLDQRRIRQVVFNLMSNALKYTPRGGVIVLGARVAGDDLQIYVSDNGPGIAASVQANVFDRFEAKGRAGQRAGAGLGLALVNRFVELHDGWVEIETGEGLGTLVRCHLPRRLGERGARPTEDAAAASAGI